MGFLQAHEDPGQGNLGTDKVRDRTCFLADSGYNGADGPHMDSPADPADSRDHEHGGVGMTGK